MYSSSGVGKLAASDSSPNHPFVGSTHPPDPLQIAGLWNARSVAHRDYDPPRKLLDVEDVPTSHVPTLRLLRLLVPTPNNTLHAAQHLGDGSIDQQIAPFPVRRTQSELLQFAGCSPS